MSLKLYIQQDSFQDRENKKGSMEIVRIDCVNDVETRGEFAVSELAYLMTILFKSHL